MVRSFKEARRKLARATKYVPIKLFERARKLNPFRHARIYKYKFIPEYVSPFKLDQLAAPEEGYDWIAEEIKAAELKGKVPSFSYNIYRDLYIFNETQEACAEEYPNFFLIRPVMRKYIAVLLGLAEEEEEEYNGFIPGREQSV